MMHTETIHRKDGTEYEKLICNPQEDNCPVCDSPLKDVYFSWRIFHGEAKASCCGAIYQIKSYSVNKDKYGEEEYNFSESLNNPDRIHSKIDGKYLMAYRQAFRELGVKNIFDNSVHKRADELLDTKQTA